MSNCIWTGNFACVAVIENTFIPNIYTVTVSMETYDKKRNISLGYQKLKYFVENSLHNSMFISKDNSNLLQINQSDNNIVLFPESPWDYLVGIVLYNKIEVITEKYFEINYMTIDSSMGDHVKYTIHDELDSGFDLKGDEWWNMDTPTSNLAKNLSWEKLNLKDSPGFSPKIIQGGLYNQ